MPISDYDVTKELVVASVTGTPTISKAQPIYLSGGDDSATGTGPVVLDWSGINGPSDIAVYDEAGNLLDYEIEELDTTNETGVLWVYNDWIRDGTVQAQVAYGNGPGDRSMAGTGSNPWDNGQNVELVFHLNGNANDSSVNNRNGTVNGATPTSPSQFDGGYSFDGIDDYIDTGYAEQLAEITVVSWFNHQGASGDTYTLWGSFDGTNEIILGNDETNDNPNLKFGVFDGSKKFAHLPNETTKNAYHQAVGRFDGSAWYINLDHDSQVDTLNDSTRVNPSNNQWIGAENRSSAQDYTEGEIDETRIYSDSKSDSWIRADYDASAKAGQVFFSQNAASGEPSPPSGSVAQTDDSGVAQTDSDGVVTTG